MVESGVQISFDGLWIPDITTQLVPSIMAPNIIKFVAIRSSVLNTVHAFERPNKEDPKEVLDNVVIAGLVGILCQFGDLVECATGMNVQKAIKLFHHVGNSYPPKNCHQLSINKCNASKEKNRLIHGTHSELPMATQHADPSE
ncbi:hypothetical protein Fot_35762 [Forsythia ovata]|uniref:Uncharacterized protein n=1 Tax=Forsythia ovata TaxID=205694 RepID=A0ABD1SNV3_9LAMI